MCLKSFLTSAKIKVQRLGLDSFPPRFFGGHRKTVVYIDGQNFLYKVADILISRGLVKDKQTIDGVDVPWLMDRLLGNATADIRYYGVKNIDKRKDLGKKMYDKSVLFADNLRRVRAVLNKTGVRFVDVGKLKIRDGDTCKKCGYKELRFQEKGVDVGLAVDIVKDAFTDAVDDIVLLSSDTDLIPAIMNAKSAGKRIIYVGFNGKITNALRAEAEITRIIYDNDVIEAWRRIESAKNIEKK